MTCSPPANPSMPRATCGVLNHYAYDAYGNVLAQTGAAVNTYLFVGQQRDGLTGLDYLRARYSSVDVGRFLSTDPATPLIDVPMTINRYVYAAADPINNTDPTGRFTLPEVLSVISIISSVASVYFTFVGNEPLANAFAVISAVTGVGAIVGRFVAKAAINKAAQEAIKQETRQVTEQAAEQTASAAFRSEVTYFYQKWTTQLVNIAKGAPGQQAGLIHTLESKIINAIGNPAARYAAEKFVERVSQLGATYIAETATYQTGVTLTHLAARLASILV